MVEMLLGMREGSVREAAWRDCDLSREVCPGAEVEMAESAEKFVVLKAGSPRVRGGRRGCETLPSVGDRRSVVSWLTPRDCFPIPGWRSADIGGHSGELG